MLLSALVFGLLGSFHCIGMCGPIAFMLPVDRTNNFKKISQIFLYHLGRIFSYSLIGLLFGLLGKSFNLFGFQQQLSIIVGVLMIAVILIPNKTFNKYNFSKPLFKIISKVKSALGKELKKKSPDTFLTIGFLNGFLPCGLVYMALFGMGTIPLMTTAIYFGNFLTGKVRQYIRKAIPVVVVLMGFLFILRGMGLGIPYISPKPIVEQINASYECY